MDLHDVAMMHGYWRRNPPLRVLVASVAAALGVNVMPQAKTFKDLKAADFDLTPGPQHTSPEAFKRLVEMTGGKIEGLGQFGG